MHIHLFKGSFGEILPCNLFLNSNVHVYSFEKHLLVIKYHILKQIFTKSKHIREKINLMKHGYI